MATRDQVAKLAGVAPSSVSYVMSNKRKVSEATRTKVLAAIRELNYHPNYMAGALSTGQSKIIAVSSPLDYFMDLQIYNEYVAGIVEAASENDFLALIVPDQTMLESGRLQSFLDSRIMAGFILVGASKQDMFTKKLVANEYPYVSVGHTSQQKSLRGVSVDLYQAASSAIDILKTQGHKKMAVIVSDEMPKSFLVEARRLEVELLIFRTENSVPAGRALAERIIAENLDLTAVICLISQANVGFRQHWDFIFGRLTTKALSYISVGSTSDMGSHLTAQVSRVSFDFRAIGREAFEQLISNLGKDDYKPVKISWKATYFQGSTVSAPRDRPLSNFYNVKENYS
jgi:DNA-binding LacI/PurR family transcriptional regulator